MLRTPAGRNLIGPTDYGHIGPYASPSSIPIDPNVSHGDGC